MITALSYVGAHWFLILSVVLGVIALGAFAWFAKNWKAALAAVVLVVAGLAYQSADLGGYKRALDEAKAQEIATLQKRLLTVSIIAKNDTERASADAFLTNKLKELSSVTPPNTSPCLDAAAAGRVSRAGRIDTIKPALPARRHSIVLPFGSKHP